MAFGRVQIVSSESWRDGRAGLAVAVATRQGGGWMAKTGAPD